MIRSAKGSICTALLAAGAMAVLLALAAAQDGESRLYPDPPAGPPASTRVANADAADEASMKMYAELITGTAVTFEMTPIAGGSFQMGSPVGEAGRRDVEGPQVEVTVSPFWMAKTETTWNEYSQFMDSLDRRARQRSGVEPAPQDRWADAVSRPTRHYLALDFDMGVDGYPAICMTQFAAKQYTKWLSMKTGRFYRLPTEAEWEYACRAGTTAPYSFPVDEFDRHGWCFENSDEGYRKVGALRPNPWGLYDMHGNVAEWCLDAFSADGYSDFTESAEDGPLIDPVRWPKSLYPRVARGGHWDDDPSRLRSAARRSSSDTWKARDPELPKSIWYLPDAPWLGFRVVRPLDPPPFEDWGKFHDADVEQIEAIRQGQR